MTHFPLPSATLLFETAGYMKYKCLQQNIEEIHLLEIQLY